MRVEPLSSRLRSGQASESDVVRSAAPGSRSSAGAPWRGGGASAADVTTSRPDADVAPGTDAADTLEPGYLVIVWNDPVNLMNYVTHVFMKVFGWSRTKAERHMLEVHERGKSVVARESLERAEFYVHQLQRYSLQATMERDQ
ncbi:MAG: ATP-dependent Clp protease adapter ClpS [Verrucomicrobia bacterium]|jgi:ATP-dependent Clp protease adaptor protein ClpS|nr:ATP-dependent Clp protease adapter ClpS [Verrucomicrobiota bacterium]